MLPPKNSNPISAKLPMPLWEFVAMMATLIGLTALAIDVMLPALDDIAEHYNRARANDQQLVLFAYIAGFGVPQLFYGPISDRYGRKGLLRICLAGYFIAAFACMATQSFALLLAARFAQGFMSSGIRVVATSIVRDLTKGRGMARIMSFIMTVFMVVPILAPMLGEGIIRVSSWQWTFGVLGVAAALTLVWVQFRLPETLAVEDRTPLSFSGAMRGYISVMKNRTTAGYILAGGFVFGALFSFLAAAEQIFTDVFDTGENFVFWFAGITATLVVGNFANAMLVERLGMRRISHTVLLGFIGFSLASVISMQIFGESLAVFYPLFALAFACFGMIGANFSAIAMEPQGKSAGTASAANGFIGTAASAILGYMVASQFDGTVTPFMVGFVALGVSALIIILITERGRLFHDGPPQE